MTQRIQQRCSFSKSNCAIIALNNWVYRPTLQQYSVKSKGFEVGDIVFFCLKFLQSIGLSVWRYVTAVVIIILLHPVNDKRHTNRRSSMLVLQYVNRIICYIYSIHLTIGTSLIEILGLGLSLK